jgi:quercetin dioxygenase-like cupin family protein
MLNEDGSPRNIAKSPRRPMFRLAGDAPLRSIPGADLVMLAVGAESMMTKMLYKAIDFVPAQAHPSEQCAYVVSGQYVVVCRGTSQVIAAGDSYSIPRYVEHSLEIIEPGEIICVFTPPYEDYL